MKTKEDMEQTTVARYEPKYKHIFEKFKFKVGWSCKELSYKYPHERCNLMEDVPVKREEDHREH